MIQILFLDFMIDSNCNKYMMDIGRLLISLRIKGKYACVVGVSVYYNLLHLLFMLNLFSLRNSVHHFCVTLGCCRWNKKLIYFSLENFGPMLRDEDNKN